MNFAIFYLNAGRPNLLTTIVQGVENPDAAIAHAKEHELDPTDEVLGALPASELEVLAKLVRTKPVIPNFMLNIRYHPEMKGAKKACSWTEFVIQNQESITRPELDKIANDLLQAKPVKVGGGAAGDFTLTFVKPVEAPSPHEVADRLLASLDLGSIAYAGDLARGEYRGVAALSDHLGDHNQMLIDAGMPELNGTGERIALMNVYIEVANRRIFDRASQLQMADTFADFARGVVSTWSKGNLAESIRLLDAALREYETFDAVAAIDAEASTAGREDTAGIFLTNKTTSAASPAKRR
jgi:hypothetical protein